jgi:hypothetical protein
MDVSLRDKMLDAFWDNQLDSKAWLVNNLNPYILENSTIYIFGGWIGVLTNMLFVTYSEKINSIYSIDIDNDCKHIAEKLNNLYIEKFSAITNDMAKFDYDKYPDIIINTSSEHVNQTTYDEWFDKIPPGSLICVQGNNYFSCQEHIRCSANLIEFKRQNHVYNPEFEGELQNSMYTRYMSIWRK